MTCRPRRHGRNRWAIAAWAVAAVGYAALAELTRPFTAAADAVTALPLAVAAVIVAVRLRSPSWSPGSPWSGSVVRPSEGEGEPPRWPLAWIFTAAVITCWELYCFAATPRSEHPTLSSLLDVLDATHAGKTLAFALWLALGFYLVVL